jgi:amino acid adenylation domain-containing protein/non-ribosomal peptide synthase protein (TIGR01720 family)
VQGASELPSSQTLFDSIVVFENYPVDASLVEGHDAIRLRHVRRGRQQTEEGVTATSGRNNYPLSLIVKDGEQLELLLAYDGRQFAHRIVAGMLRQLRNLLQAFCARPDANLSSLSLCDGEERIRIVEQWNDYRMDVAFRSIPSQIAAHAAATPDAIALYCEDRQLSYRELDRQSNRLAQYLAEQGVKPEVRVAVCLPRSLDLVVALNGILKAGGVAVPLDPKMPAQRLAYQLADAKAMLAIGEPDSSPAQHGKWLNLNDPELARYSDSPLPERIRLQHAAYVIYTSGSTGQPKGVVVSHGALANYVAVVRSRLPENEIASMAWVSTVAADLGHTVLFGALAAGKCLHVIAEERAFDPDRFAEYMTGHRIDALKIVPSHLAGLMQAADPGQVLPRRCLIVGGEAASWSLVERLQALAPDCHLLNHYGPTETTVGVLTYPYDPALRPDSRHLPLGKPLANNRIYVLDAHLHPVPHGVPGEVYVGGAQLARGYLERPDLTAERFIPDPFGTAGERLYRTGDIARLLPDGNLEYLDRADNQIKIRGYRVEPGEIAAQLKLEPDVSDAVVVLSKTDESARLIAYVLATPECDLAAVKEALAERLPDYMVPSVLVRLDKWPLTSNGKLDRRALPAPEAKVSADKADKTAPRNEAEAALAAVWQEVLKLERVGIHDSFFSLGGDSILSLQVIAKTRAKGWKLTPKQMFEKPTIAEAAQVAVPIAAKAKAAVVEAGGEVPLTPIQSWFFEQKLAAPHHWNQSVLLAAAEPLNSNCLETALRALVMHHDALRLRFVEDEGGVRQVQLAEETHALLQAIDLPSEAGIDEACSRVQAGLNIAHGPLLATAHLRLASGAERLLVAIHHLAVDGVSWRVLLEDLQTAYSQALAGQAVSLPAKSSSWQAWAGKLRSYVQSPALNSELAYWQSALQPMALPCMNPRGENSVGTAERIALRLNAEETRQLLQLAPAAYRTQINDLLLAALAQTLCGWSGSAHALIELEGHGREDLFDDIDLSRTVGWFTSRFPVCLTPSQGPAATIKAVKEQLRAIPHKGIGHGLLKYLGDTASRAALDALPQPQVSFNYLGQFDQAQGEGVFKLAAGGTGENRAAVNRRSHWLDIVGQVSDGELVLTWIYSPDVLDRAGIEAAARDYIANLRGLITHCLSAEGGATPSDFPLADITQAELDSLPVAAIEDIYPLAPMQQGMLFHSLYAPDNDVYVNQLHCTLSGVLDVDAFRTAWDAAIADHAILRTSFLLEREGDALQIVWREAMLPFIVLDWRHLAPSQHAERLAEFLAQDRARSFVLEQVPLTQIALIVRHDGATEFVWTKHHLLLDGWSSARLLNDVLAGYFAALEGGRRSARPAPGRYRDYVEWVKGQSSEDAERFWRAMLAGLNDPLRLADAVARPEVPQTGHGARVLHLPADMSASLQQCAQQQQVTLNTVLQAAWALLLSRYSGRRDIVFGVTVAGRSADVPGIEDMLGLFINTLPMFQQLDSTQRVGAWLQNLQRANTELRQFESTPLADIQRWNKAGGGNALFDTLFVFENYPVDAALGERRARLGIEHIRAHNLTSYPLTLTVVPGERLRLDFVYNRTCFDDAMVERMQMHLRRLLQALLDDADARIGELPLLDAQEWRQVTREWNATEVVYPQARPVHELFAQQAAATPDMPALVFGAQSLSYRELDAAANRLAHRLLTAGVACDSLVGICAERSLEMVVGLLAILKAGAAYVPLDPDYPAERLATMIEDAGIPLLLTQETVWSRLGVHTDVQVLPLTPEADAAFPATDPGISIHPQQLAYTIYTSGSTGQPKGAGVSHQGLNNRLLWMQETYRLTPDDRVLQKTPFGFDVSVWEFFWPLMTGATLVMAAPGDHKDPARLTELIQGHGITTLHFVPSMLHAFVEHGSLPHCTSLRRMLASGEALPAELRARCMRQTKAALHNLYGPTEAAIDVTAWACSEADIRTVPIGKPIANTQLYVLDGDMNPVPVGVAGELYIGGIQLARGYHGRPALTAERFLPDPFGRPGGRLYRTGDVARWRDDGAIDYLGRTDHQVKIRGVRIELGEIEAKLLAHLAVREAVVVAREEKSGDKRLVAYVVAREAVTAEALRTHLQQGLPESMVPAAFVFLEALPLNPNGKLDRKALPAPEYGGPAKAYVAPRSKVERQLAQIWAEVLGVEKIGIHDNFFALGGHSLLAMQVASRSTIALGRKVELASLFRHPTIAALAETLSQEAPSSASYAALMADLLNELE